MEHEVSEKDSIKKDNVYNAEYVEKDNNLDNVRVDENSEFVKEKVGSKIKNKGTKNNEVSMGGLIILVIILSLISGFLGSYLVLSNASNYISSEGGIIKSTAILEETNSISSAVDKIYDAVVVVEVYDKEKLVSTGTGFVYKKDDNKAFLMTNNHVVSSKGEIKVLFTNGEELEAELVGSDTYSDIAVLSVKDNDNIVSSVLGKSEDSKIGDTVFAIGSPQGSNYAGTVTKGIISAKDRVVEVALSNSQATDYFMDVLQTDAAINPGNSGGPICNINGEVIGITNMKLVDDTVEGMGFAIPIESALEVANILEKNGELIRPYIGVEMLDLSNEFNLWKAGILVPEGIDSGVAVYNVVEGSPADKAGLKKGDIIVKLGDRDVDGFADFRYELYKHSPGEEVVVIYNRDGKEKKTTIVLGEGE